MSVTLAGDRVFLSGPTTDDVDAIARHCQDEAVQRWTTVPNPYKRADAEGFIDHVVEPGWATGAELTWGIRDAAGGPLRGMIGLSRRDETCSEIGFWLAAEGRGRGSMREAVALVCGYGLSADGPALQRIEWRAFTGNVASASVARRVGFRYEGILRLGGVQRDVRVDQWVAGLLHTDTPPDADAAQTWPAETWPAGTWPAGTWPAGASSAETHAR